MKKTMSKKTVIMTILFVCLLVAVVGGYAYLSNRKKEDRAESKLTFVQQTLSRDLQNDYPPTPKEVIRYYNDILRCFYNEKATEDEIDLLGQKARELYDEELLEENELGIYMIRLREDIQAYKDKERRITSFTVSSSTSVKFFEEDGYSFARLQGGYNIVEDKKDYSVRLVYLVRKDASNRWKIYGWDNASNLQGGESIVGE